MSPVIDPPSVIAAVRPPWRSAETIPAGADGQPRVLEGLAEFREHLGGQLTVTLLGGVGKGFEVHEMDGARVARALAWLRRRAQP